MGFLNISFFKLPKHRVFNYTPRYYDPEKEKLEERKREIAHELGVKLEEDASKENEPYRPNIKGKMQHVLTFGRRKSSLPQMNRMVGFILLLLIIVALYFGSDLFGLLFSNTNPKAKTNTEQQQEVRKKNEDTHFIIPLPEKK